jgi:hypothetical protein
VSITVGLEGTIIPKWESAGCEVKHTASAARMGKKNFKLFILLPLKCFLSKAFFWIIIGKKQKKTATRNLGEISTGARPS